MKIGLVGPSYQERSLPFDCQRTINLFPVFNETGQGKEVSALYGTPGMLAVAYTGGYDPARGCYAATNGRAFIVIGTDLYELTASFELVSRGSLDGSSGTVSIDENGTQLAICDGASVYIFTYATNVFAKVTDTDLPSAGTLKFIDGYFVVNKNNSGAFYISALYDGTSWDALDFATAESSPDNLVRVYNALGQLWLFGDKTTEIWSNVGGSGFPFERISGGKIDIGLAAAHSVVAMDNAIFWLGQDTKGSGIIYRSQGFNPQRISTHAIEYKLQQAGDLSALVAYTYQQDGHVFYVLTGSGLNTTLVWDNSTNLWHERAFQNEGVYETHLATCHMYAFGKHLVGSRAQGTVYEMDLDVYYDAGFYIRRQRIFTHIGDEGKRFRVRSLRVDFERGVGLTAVDVDEGETQDAGVNPLAMLRVSKDGGRSWSNEYSASFGALGARTAACAWNRLGYFEQLTIELTISDPVKVAICGAYLE